MADTHIYLKLDDVKGESTATGFVDQIEIESMRWSLAAKASQTATHEQAKAQLDYGTVELEKHFDRATPQLLNRTALIEGDDSPRKGFEKATLTLVDMVIDPAAAESKCVPVMQIVLEDGFVEGLLLRAGESGKSMRIEETLTLSFRKINYTYYKSSGKRGARGEALTFVGQTTSESA